MSLYSDPSFFKTYAIDEEKDYPELETMDSIDLVFAHVISPQEYDHGLESIRVDNDVSQKTNIDTQMSGNDFCKMIAQFGLRKESG